MNDTERLDFLLNNTIEWQGFTNHPEKEDYWELQIWDRGACKEFEGKSQRECIDKAIEDYKKCQK